MQGAIFNSICFPKVVIGDQLTCKNIRGAKKWREPELVAINRLQWANEVPGKKNIT